METLLHITPHSLALLLTQSSKKTEKDSSSSPSNKVEVPEKSPEQNHLTGYEVFASFKAVNMQHFWNKALTDALPEVLFLGWIDEQVLLVQGGEVHLQVLRDAWTRRTLNAPQGFDIKSVGG